MSPRHLAVLAVAAAAALGASTPADAYLCAEYQLEKDDPTRVCVPWGNPLPDLSCAVTVPDLLRVCT